MNIVGKWQVAKMMGRDEADNIVWLDKEEYTDFLKRRGSDEETIQQRMVSFDQKIIFTEDKMVEICLPIPPNVSQAEIDAAVAEGAVKIVDGMMIMCASDPDDEMQWKEENGEFFTSEAMNMVTNEMSWGRLKVIDDDTLEFALYLITRL